jgi:hypothetical protein
MPWPILVGSARRRVAIQRRRAHDHARGNPAPTIYPGAPGFRRSAQDWSGSYAKWTHG